MIEGEVINKDVAKCYQLVNQGEGYMETLGPFSQFFCKF